MEELVVVKEATAGSQSKSQLVSGVVTLGVWGHCCERKNLCALTLFAFSFTRVTYIHFPFRSLVNRLHT